MLTLWCFKYSGFNQIKNSSINGGGEEIESSKLSNEAYSFKYTFCIVSHEVNSVRRLKITSCEF